MRNYETGYLTGKQADNFVSQFDSSIGTETEVTKHDNNHFVVSCFELTANEVSKCRTIEKRVTR